MIRFFHETFNIGKSMRGFEMLTLILNFVEYFISFVQSRRDLRNYYYHYLHVINRLNDSNEPPTTLNAIKPVAIVITTLDVNVSEYNCSRFNNVKHETSKWLTTT